MWVVKGTASDAFVVGLVNVGSTAFNSELFARAIAAKLTIPTTDVATVGVLAETPSTSRFWLRFTSALVQRHYVAEQQKNSAYVDGYVVTGVSTTNSVPQQAQQAANPPTPSPAIVPQGPIVPLAPTPRELTRKGQHLTWIVVLLCAAAFIMTGVFAVYILRSTSRGPARPDPFQREMPMMGAAASTQWNQPLMGSPSYSPTATGSPRP